MATKIIQTCDRCAASNENLSEEAAVKWQLWNLWLDYTRLPHEPSTLTYRTAKAQWCRTCMEEMQLLGRPSASKDAAALPAVTLEDQIREIVREEIEAAK